MRHDSSIVEFQQKRGGDSAAFFVPFLTSDTILLDAGCGPGTITAALAGIVGKAVGVDLEPNAIVAAHRCAAEPARPRAAIGGQGTRDRGRNSGGACRMGRLGTRSGCGLFQMPMRMRRAEGVIA